MSKNGKSYVFVLTTIEKQSKNTLQFSKSGGTIMSSSWESVVCFFLT